MKKSKNFFVGCCLLVLFVCFYVVACCDYCGIVLAYKYGMDIELPAYGEYDEDGVLLYNDYMIFRNRFGRIAILQTDYKNVEIVGTFSPKLCTHLRMLSLREGMTTVQIVAELGMPLGETGSGLSRLVYETVDGYQYHLFFKSPPGEYTGVHAQVLSYWAVMAPESERYMDDSEMFAFQWQIRFFYIGLAAVLSVILVCLLVVPKKIEKRKAQSKGENCNA